MKINTRLLHGYPVICEFTGAVSIPKYQSSTFNQKQLFGNKQDYTYTRFNNPTVSALDEAFKMLFNARYALSFASGMAAISTGLMLFKQGDHMIFPIEVYGGTYQFTSEIMSRYGIEVSYVDMSDANNIVDNIRKNTRLIYIETPSNPLLKITDIPNIVNIAKSNNILTMADNTFMSFLYQNPLDYGVDIVTESITKFINGHSDVTGGLLVTNNEELYNKLKVLQKNFGGILGIEDAWLVLRGLKTMGLRMNTSVNNAQKIAEFLQVHPKIKKVYYPGLKDHVDHDLHFKQATSGGAVLSFELESVEAVDKFSKTITLPILAVSLGGVESILSYPTTMSHAVLSVEERYKQGVSDELLRLSVGIEDCDDLLEDLNQALEKI